MKEYKVSEFQKISQLIDDYAKILVGILCKRVEVLEKEEVLTPNLYKSIIKENIYEQTRNLKKVIEIYLEIGKIVFKTREK